MSRWGSQDISLSSLFDTLFVTLYHHLQYTIYTYTCPTSEVGLENYFLSVQRIHPRLSLGLLRDPTQAPRDTTQYFLLFVIAYSGTFLFVKHRIPNFTSASLIFLANFVNINIKYIFIQTVSVSSLSQSIHSVQYLFALFGAAHCFVYYRR